MFELRIKRTAEFLEPADGSGEFSCRDFRWIGAERADRAESFCVHSTVIFPDPDWPSTACHVARIAI